MAEDGSNVVAIHIRRLRARLDFDAVANAASKACFGFDIRVLDEARFKLTFNGNVRLRQRVFDVASHHATAHQHVAGAVLDARAEPRRRVRRQL